MTTVRAHGEGGTMAWERTGGVKTAAAPSVHVQSLELHGWAPAV